MSSRGCQPVAALICNLVPIVFLSSLRCSICLEVSVILPSWSSGFGRFYVWHLNLHHVLWTSFAPWRSPHSLSSAAMTIMSVLEGARLIYKCCPRHCASRKHTCLTNGKKYLVLKDWKMRVPEPIIQSLAHRTGALAGRVAAIKNKLGDATLCAT